MGRRKGKQEEELINVFFNKARASITIFQIVSETISMKFSMTKNRLDGLLV